jgi:squalene-hopene/tetraprenyl-beta-curcumene cyclase
MPQARRTVAAFALLGLTLPAGAIDEEHRRAGEDLAAQAIAWLRERQDERTGGWSVSETGPQLPGITGLVMIGMLDAPTIDGTDPAMDRAARWLLSLRQADGGVYDRILPSYNTSIALAALARMGTPEVEPAIVPLQRFLRGLQYAQTARVEPGGGEVQIVGPAHPFYGGVGYGTHGRPDLSNLGLMLEAMRDSGVPGDDEVFRRAIVFLQRTQMLDGVNDMPYARGSSQGGFIYSTGTSRDEAGMGQSMSLEPIEETLDDGTRVSRLRAYGSMTYVGFKSYLYADLAPDDPRVAAAYDWISRHYTLDENPGLGTDGMYYYFVAFARALHARGDPAIEVVMPDGSRAVRDWGNDLVDRLSGLQEPDGSFRVLDDRWMESNPVLITAYGLIALQYALGNGR